MFNLKNKIIELDSVCENALIDFPFHEHPATWLKDHQLLMTNCALLIVDDNFKNLDKRYSSNLLEFLKLYATYQKK